MFRLLFARMQALALEGRVVTPAFYANGGAASIAWRRRSSVIVRDCTAFPESAPVFMGLSQGSRSVRSRCGAFPRPALSPRAHMARGSGTDPGFGSVPLGY